MLENPRSRRLHARRTFSRMAPRKPDTMEPLPVSTRPEIGRGDPTAPVYHLCVISPPLFCPLWIVYAQRIIHRNNSSYAVPSPPRPVRCYPLFPRFALILTVSLITGAIRGGWTRSDAFCYRFCPFCSRDQRLLEENYSCAIRFALQVEFIVALGKYNCLIEDCGLFEGVDIPEKKFLIENLS